MPVCARVCELSSLSPTCSDLKLRVRILIDGTLIIFRVKPEDAGKYTCTPSNSLGISPSALAHLTVQCECYHSNKVCVGGDDSSSSSVESGSSARIAAMLK